MHLRSLPLMLVLLTVLGTGLWVRAEEEQHVTVFRDLAWGDPIEALGKAIRPEETEDLATKSVAKYATNALFGLSGDDRYNSINFQSLIRESEPGALGSIPVEVVAYAFLDEQLMSVNVLTPDPQRLLDTLIAKYGEPEESFDYVGTTVSEADCELMFKLRFIMDDYLAKMRLLDGMTFPSVLQEPQFLMWQNEHSTVFFWGQKWGHLELRSKRLWEKAQSFVELAHKEKVDNYKSQVESDANAW